MSGGETLHEMWKGFAEQCLPRGASALQVRESEMYFKSGAAALLLAMRDRVSALPDDQAITVLEQWRREYLAFLAARCAEHDRGGMPR